MNIYMMRHGETDANKEKKFQGRQDHILNRNGIEQAKQAGKKLEGISFDACYVSPLVRAIRTAELATGWKRERFHREERLIEISFGVMEGKTYEESGEVSASFFDKPECYIPPKGAESFEQLINRVSDFLTDLKKNPYENVLIVSHGAALHALLLVLDKRELKDFWQIDIGNCQIIQREI